MAEQKVSGPWMSESLDRDQRIGDLFEMHYPGLCRLAYLIVGDIGDAEEIVMEAFVRTFASWHRIRDLDRSDAYLRRAVVNLSRTRFRRQRGKERQQAAAWQPSSPNRPADIEGDLVVWHAIQQLPHRQRAAVVLRYYEDLSESEIARLLRCSPGTVKSQLAKARARLAQHLQKEEEDV
ncbi:MAG: SigE family RNA polymerase sigma factor [Actinomycetota bacterium]|nr:SigE family RNA polymerase sigma factor [Actinomycetota bacterium]